jgi:hypothetical protein
MSVDRLSPWRRTRRKASDDHYVKLQTMSLVEFPGYDNRGNQQGKVLACHITWMGSSHSTSVQSPWLAVVWTHATEALSMWMFTGWSSLNSLTNSSG